MIQICHLQAKMSLLAMIYVPITVVAMVSLVIALTMCHMSHSTIQPLEFCWKKSHIYGHQIMIRTPSSHTFGCGQVITGSFLDIAASNGLFGLGFEKVSAPSISFWEGHCS